MNCMEVNQTIYMKQLLEDESKYLGRMLEFGDTTTNNIRKILLDANRVELTRITIYIRANCKHQWITEEFTTDKEVIYCNFCGLGHK